MPPSQLVPVLLAVLMLSGCVNQGLPEAEGIHKQPVKSFEQARNAALPSDRRAAFYLDSAARALALIAADPQDEAASLIYNKAVANLTVLLREESNGSLWNRPLTLSTGTDSYQLRFAKGSREGIWDPATFTSFKPAEEVRQKTIRRENHQDGIGGVLVGIRKTDPREPFSPLVGVTAPVTAVIDFKGRVATLSLIDPSEKTKTRVAGADRSLGADFSAPLAYYPQKSEYWEGIMGAIRVSDYMKTTGLYMLQPYDPDRIPLIFVHGLISTPRMWRNVINELEADPSLRGRYQCWVFAYPTGNPPSYSALRFREELDKVRHLYPEASDYVLVGHSMGGLVSRMQTTTVTRKSWDVAGEDRASQLFSNMKKGSLVERCTLFQANPKIDRVIFICTPHRGSEMAIGSIGELGMRLISLPLDLTATVAGSLGNSLASITGDPKRMPNSVTGLSPKNPMLKVLDSRPIEAAHHTIAGDRGKGDTPNSSDGVVQYWSSRQLRAKSECIVPGPHGACELPETLAELRRILHLHLKENGKRR